MSRTHQETPMTEFLPHIIAGLVGAVVGGATILWIMKRPTTTKAMALNALALEAELVAKMPGVADQQALVQQEMQSEALAAQRAAAAIAKAAGGQP